MKSYYLKIPWFSVRLIAESGLFFLHLLAAYLSPFKSLLLITAAVGSQAIIIVYLLFFNIDKTKNNHTSLYKLNQRLGKVEQSAQTSALTTASNTTPNTSLFLSMVNTQMQYAQLSNHERIYNLKLKPEVVDLEKEFYQSLEKEFPSHRDILINLALLELATSNQVEFKKFIEQAQLSDPNWSGWANDRSGID